MRIVVIGGTGLIGGKAAALLRQAGLDVLAASPNTGVNTLTGEGLHEALAGAEVTIDLANSPSFADEAVLAFFDTAGRNLLGAAAQAGIRHHVALSVVGVDRMPDNGYFRAKLVQERLIRESGLPYTIVRSTQFLEFLATIALGATEGQTVRLAPGLFQPIAADDVAAIVTELALGPPQGGMIEIAGPERAPLDETIGRYLRLAGDPRHVKRDEAARYFGAVVDRHSLVPTGPARTGRIDLETWFRRQGAPIRNGG